MTNLDKDTIDAIKKISDAVEGTGFEMNRFDVSDSAIENRQIINFDIRRIVEKTKDALNVLDEVEA